MYDYYDYYPSDIYGVQRNVSYARVLHASPDAPAVDVYVNNRKIASNLAYKNFTQYIQLNPGNYNVRVFPAGRTTNPVINQDINIQPNSIFTVAATGKLNNISLYPISEPRLTIPPGRVYVRFAHLSPGAPNVDIRLPDGTTLFRNVGYRQATNYIPVTPGTYTLEAYPTGADQRVLYVPNMTLKPNRFYTVYAVGLAEGEPPLQVLIPLDGNSYL
ncbi:DUF4397 domain-containing protein [Thermohalobacter berrensis]|uniref:DUF4397 domain-containing protein n=1 Tax=Thermohalobacter berrensis TaxID=99594 RepID=A0A419SZ53_9FIRM|nr:DUF4397 domain-containing protein [Thermohalobacter berrensis]RKD30542.1 hypothetical protein BET03_04175 [Thermohalobacter berrensis]